MSDAKVVVDDPYDHSAQADPKAVMDWFNSAVTWSNKADGTNGKVIVLGPIRMSHLPGSDALETPVSGP